MADDPVKRLREAARLLNDAADAAERGVGGRDGIDIALVDAVGAQRQLYGPRPRAKKGEGALHKLRDYLIAHVGEEVSGEELRYVSGIQEWARRIRELRVEHGYEITEHGPVPTRDRQPGRGTRRPVADVERHPPHEGQWR